MDLLENQLLRLDTADFVGSGTMVSVLKQVRKVSYENETFKILVKKLTS